MSQGSAQQVMQVTKGRVDQVVHQLKGLGASAYDLRLPESHILPYIVRPDEWIIGIIFGKYKQAGEGRFGRGALVATDRRVILLDKKPLFVKCDELMYRAISGVAYSRSGLMGTVILHSRTGDIQMRTYNQLCAKSFIESVESKLFAAESEGSAV